MPNPPRERTPAAPLPTEAEGTAESHLKLMGSADDARSRCSMVAMESEGRVYRIEFWSDHEWAMIPIDQRPLAQRAHQGQGWFLISPSPRG